MEQLTLFTSPQRKSIADNYRKIEQIREIIGLNVKVSPKANLKNIETGVIIGWRFNENEGVDYVIKLFENDQCVLISEEDSAKGYTFVG